MQKEWLSVAELAKAAQIPESTLRRYLARYDKYMQYQQRPRGRRYHVSTIDVLARIRHLFVAGLTEDEIDNVLAREYPITVSDSDEDITPYEQTIPLPYATRDDVMAAVDVLRAELEVLRAQNDQLRRELTERLEMRDKHLMETLRAIQERAQDRAKRRWWPFG